MARSSFRLLFAGLAAAGLLTGCDIKVDDGRVSLGVSRGRAADEWVRSYTLNPRGRFEIANENGQLEVRRATGPDVKVKAFREVSSSNDEDARQRLTNLQMKEEVSPDRVFVQAQTGDNDRLGFGRGVTVRYEVEVPDGLTVVVKTMNGAVRLDGVHGQITAATTNGNVSGESIEGTVQGSTVNGSVSIDVDQLKGDVRLTTVNGSIRLEVPQTANADLDAATVNGGVLVDDQLGLADVTRDRGSFGPATSIRGRLNKGGARISLQTTNGGVRVSARGNGDRDDADAGRGLERRGRRGRAPGF